MVTINDHNLADLEVPNFLNNAPFMQVAAAVPASNETIHKWLRYVNPSVGFREVNLGRETQKSVDTMVSVECEILDGTFGIDAALVKTYRKGGDTGWIAREAARHLNAMFFKAEQQVFQGVGVGTLGFLGLPDITEYKFLDSARVKGAGGTTVGGQSSVWLVRFGGEDVEVVMGHNGDITQEDPVIVEATPATGSGTFPKVYVPMHGWLGLKVGSTVTSAYRIANVESLNDDMIFEALAEFGVGREPHAIFCTRKIRETLRKSRTATNNTGSPAPIPTEVGGIPVYATDGILNTEAVLANEP
jgi:hypothetical protein